MAAGNRTVAVVDARALAILPSDDVFIPPTQAAAIESAVGARAPSAGPGVTWRVPAAGHLLALHADPDEYRRRLETFLQQAFSTGGPAATPAPPK